MYIRSILDSKTPYVIYLNPRLDELCLNPSILIAAYPWDHLYELRIFGTISVFLEIKAKIGFPKMSRPFITELLFGRLLEMTAMIDLQEYNHIFIAGDDLLKCVIRKNVNVGPDVSKDRVFSSCFINK